MIEVLHPSTEQEWLNLRARDITSTEIGALFGISPYVSIFELWHRKRENKVVELEDNDAMKWGRRLQDSIAAGVAEDNGLTIRRMDEYIRNPELRIGSSFDFSIEEEKTALPIPISIKPWALNTYPYFVGVGLLEIKNVFGIIFKDEWLEDEEGNLEAPPHIEIQVQHQLAISGRKFAWIAALISGNKIVLIKRVAEPKIIDAIKKRSQEFWDSVDSGIPPTPNFERDAAFLSSIYNYAEPGTVHDGRGDRGLYELCEEYQKQIKIIKSAEAQKAGLKATILTMIGCAEKVLGDGFTISAGEVGPAVMNFERKGFRMFRINWPTEKEIV